MPLHRRANALLVTHVTSVDPTVSKRKILRQHPFAEDCHMAHQDPNTADELPDPAESTAPAPSPAPLLSDELRRRIAERACCLSEATGWRQDGALDDWLEAERQIAEEDASRSEPSDDRSA